MRNNIEKRKTQADIKVSNAHTHTNTRTRTNAHIDAHVYKACMFVFNELNVLCISGSMCL